MRHLKLIGLSLIAVFVLGAAAASLASAESAGVMMLPDSNGGLAGATFSFASTTGVEVKWETLAGSNFGCTAVSGKGEASSDPLGKVSFKFTGCREPALNVKCSNTATTGEIVVEGEYHYRYLLPSPNSGVHLVILLPGVTFKCSTLVTVEVKGCVSSMDLLKAKPIEKVELKLEDELVKSFFAEFLIKAASKGDQELAEIDNEAGTAMEPCVRLTSVNKGTFESSAWQGSMTVEKFEKPAGTPIEVLLMH